jgi:hypothetical protein
MNTSPRLTVIGFFLMAVFQGCGNSDGGQRGSTEWGSVPSTAGTTSLIHNDPTGGRSVKDCDYFSDGYCNTNGDCCSGYCEMNVCKPRGGYGGSSSVQTSAAAGGNVGTGGRPAATGGVPSTSATTEYCTEDGVLCLSGEECCNYDNGVECVYNDSRYPEAVRNGIGACIVYDPSYTITTGGTSGSGGSVATGGKSATGGSKAAGGSGVGGLPMTGGSASVVQTGGTISTSSTTSSVRTGGTTAFLGTGGRPAATGGVPSTSATTVYCAEYGIYCLSGMDCCNYDGGVDCVYNDSRYPEAVRNGIGACIVYDPSYTITTGGSS